MGWTGKSWSRVRRAAVALAVGLPALAARPQATARDGGTAPADGPRSRAELSHFEQTSREADIDAFLADLGARTDRLRTFEFGRSEQGRPLWLAVASNPPPASPAELRGRQATVVLLQANIHAGEVEGKEATLHLLRRLCIGDLAPLLDDVVVLAMPNYNADGNEAVDLQNRTEQYGPIDGVGRRENAKGLDLNRDYVKLDSAEARAFVGVLRAWDPHVVVDLHTTNGSHHGYHLTYSIPLNPSLEPRLLDLQRKTLMPALQRALAENGGWRSYYYGNFEGEGADRRWAAFDHRPRLGQNYVGLRNRVAILSEAYSYLPFDQRIAVTEEFCEQILRWCAREGALLRGLVHGLDADFVAAARGTAQLPLGVEHVMQPLPNPVEILEGEVTTKLNPRNGKPMTVALDSHRAIAMRDFGEFRAVRNVHMARAYLFPRTAQSAAAVEKLRQHGIVVEELLAPLSAEVVRFTVRRTLVAEREFQGHRTVRLAGDPVVATETFPTGTRVVRLAQPLGRLAAYLLEPESDDGLVTWNFFDGLIVEGEPAPVAKLMHHAAMSTRVLGGP